MGIVNVTPDSFSDGGRFSTPKPRWRTALELVADGADMLDVGGESTRPGADRCGRWRRCGASCPVIEADRGPSGVAISIDTRKPEVARAALDAGATIVNDVSAVRDDPGPGAWLRAGRAGDPDAHAGRARTMQRRPRYDDVVREVAASWTSGRRPRSIGHRPGAGVAGPGLGFGKSRRAQPAPDARSARHSPALAGPSSSGLSPEGVPRSRSMPAS